MCVIFNLALLARVSSLLGNEGGGGGGGGGSGYAAPSYSSGGGQGGNLQKRNYDLQIRNC